MLYSASDAQCSYFRENGFLILEELLSETRVAALKIAVKESGPTTLDLWRTHHSVAREFRSRKIASLITELSRQHALRIGFDRPISEGELLGLSLETLSALSGIEGLSFALFICLDSGNSTLEAGSGLFIGPDCVITEELGASGASGIVFGFAHPMAITVRDLRGVAGAHLKDLEYVAGEPLNDRCHPPLSR